MEIDSVPSVVGCADLIYTGSLLDVNFTSRSYELGKLYIKIFTTNICFYSNSQLIYMCYYMNCTFYNLFIILNFKKRVQVYFFRLIFIKIF